ncbi:hypothetical protein C8R45DRAFT_941484 [Mycena sanguinolenta]|nr:hypothetical protein C8R45DRAFT_941484 [Mycena sanguinolenta]
MTKQLATISAVINCTSSQKMKYLLSKQKIILRLVGPECFGEETKGFVIHSQKVNSEAPQDPLTRVVVFRRGPVKDKPGPVLHTQRLMQLPVITTGRDERHAATCRLQVQCASRDRPRAAGERRRAPLGPSRVMSIGREPAVGGGFSRARDLLDVFAWALGIACTLAEVGVGRNKFDLLAEHSVFDAWVATNSAPITEKAQLMEILEMVAE